MARAASVRKCLGTGALLLLAAGTLAAQGASDLFLIDLEERDGTLTAGKVTRLTDRAGYDNQPTFLRGTPFILYTSIDSAGQADIWRYDTARGETAPLTSTHPESEYSATLMPAGDRISVVRVERDSTQRLWSFATDGTDPRVVLSNVKPVGYHAWIDTSRVVVFVLGDPATLQMVDLRDGATHRFAQNVGRALQRTPFAHSVSFVERDADSAWIKIFNADLRTVERVIKPLGNEYHVWTPAGTLISAQDATLYQSRPGANRTWTPFADLASAGIAGITRLALSPDGRQLVVVAARP